jgi:hypothetical protein
MTKQLAALALWQLAACVPSHGQVGGAFVGSSACAACHPDKAAAQSKSEHARALARPAEHGLAKQFAPRDATLAGKYRFRFLRSADELHVRASDASRTYEFSLEWAFGAGAKAVTFASYVSSDWYLENALSYYPARGGYSRTPGQATPTDDTLSAALGRLYRTDDSEEGIRPCFQCHSTGPVQRDGSGRLEPSEPGVRCEACHGAGGDHHAAARTGRAELARTAIANPGTGSPSGMNQECGKCHRAPAQPGQETDWNVAWNVRHQPVYLNQAACFRNSGGRLRCTTCHNPHEALRTDDAFYNDKCMECHRAEQNPPGRICSDPRRGNCVNCHMPRVSPQPFLEFTNHWIGVYGAGNKLRPELRK